MTKNSASALDVMLARRVVVCLLGEAEGRNFRNFSKINHSTLSSDYASVWPVSTKQEEAPANTRRSTRRVRSAGIVCINSKRKRVDTKQFRFAIRIQEMNE